MTAVPPFPDKTDRSEQLYCDCCGNEIYGDDQHWCDRCLPHIKSNTGAPLWERTFHAQQKRDCPFQVGLCGVRKPGGTTTCVEPARHAGPDGKGDSHGDGSVIRWIYRDANGAIQ